MIGHFSRSSRALLVALSMALVLEAAAAPAFIATGLQPPVSAPPPVADHVDAEEVTTPADEPSEPIELAELRTETSRTIDNHDGTLTTELFSQPIHYQPEGAETWQPVEIGFETVDAEGVRAESARGPVAIALRDVTDPAGFLAVQQDEHRIAFTFAGAAAEARDASRVADVAPALADPAVAVYRDVLPGVDLQVHAGAEGPKTFIVLNGPDAANAFAFGIDAAGLALRPTESGAVDFVDETGTAVARMPQPYAVDSSVDELRDGGTFTDAVQLTLTEDGGGVSLTVDPEWLAKATFPVYVDPSVAFYPDSSTYGDAFVSQAYPTQNFADYVRPDSPYYHEHWLGTDPTNSSSINYVYLRFDLSSIDATTITGAELRVVPYHQYYNAPTATTTWVDRVAASWTESGLTWNNRPSSNNLGSAGLVEGQWGAFDVESTVQAWVSGTQTNYGFRLHENGNNTTYWKRLISYEQGSNRPYLSVTYHVPTATTTTPNDFTASKTVAWAYADTSGHAQSHYQVQVSTSSTFRTILHDSGAITGTAASYTIPSGVTLSAGTQYWWRVRVRDGTSWSPYDGSMILWDNAIPAGSVNINAGAASTNASSVHLVLSGTDGGTTSAYTNDGRALTSVVGCGSTVCGSFATPTIGSSRAEGAVVARAPSAAWHTLTVDAAAANRTAIAFDVMRDSATPTYVGVVGDGNDGFRFELRSSGGNLTSLGYTATSTPGTFTTQTVNYAFTPGVWYRFVLTSSGTSGTARMWWFERDSDMPAAPTKTVTGVYVPAPRPHLFFQGGAGSVAAHVWLDDINVDNNAGSAPYGSGTVAMRFSSNGSTWTNWRGYFPSHEFVVPAGSGTRTVYAEFRDAVGTTSSTVNDTIGVAFDNFGRQPQHQAETWDVGGGDELAVNLANGNLVVSHPIVSLPYRGGNVLPLALTYNAQAADDVGLGAGWQLDVQRRLVLNGDGTVTFVDADGARHTFTAPQTAGTVTTYTRPATLYATLAKDTNQSVEFRLIFRDLRVDRFDIIGSSGRLTSIADRFGNALELGYDGSDNLATITDPAASSVVDFTWDTAPTPDRITTITDWAWVDGSGIVQTTATGSRRAHRFFYDGSGQLSGWAEALNTSGSCPTAASYRTCLTYADGLLTKVAKTQTHSTFDDATDTLGTDTRPMDTTIAWSGSRVATVSDAAARSTTFAPDGSDRVVVRRPLTTTIGNFQATADAYGRLAYTWRAADELTEIEQRTTWDATYPIEPASITDNYGALAGAPARTTSYTYVASSLGLLSRLIEPLNATDDRWTDYAYNANNDLVSTVVSLEGSTTQRTETRFCYSSDDPCPSATSLSLLGQIENYVDGTGGTGAGLDDHDTDVRTDFVTDANGQRIRTIRHNRAAGGAWLDDRQDRSTYDSAGNLTVEVINYADGAVSSSGTDVTAAGTPPAHTDLTTTHTYDTAGNRVSIADPRRAIVAATGSPGADDFVTRWTYDALNRQRTEKTPTTPGISGTQQATTAYDERGDARSTTDFGGLVTATAFDAAGIAVATYEDPDADVARQTGTTSLDAAGRPAWTKNELQLADSLLGRTEFTYDGLGRQVLVVEAAGSAAASDTETTYDGLDRRTSYIVAGQDTAYTFHLGGRVLATDDGFTCTTETFDYRDRATATVYGKAGNGCTGSGQYTVTHTYDGLGRLVRDETGSLRSVDDVFDAVGNRRSSAPVTAAAGGGTETITTTFSVNVLDQTVAETRVEGSTSRTSETTYDPAGNAVDRCAWETTSSGSCPAGTNPPATHSTTTYDARNQRLTLTDGATNQTTVYSPVDNYQPSRVYTPLASGVELQTKFEYDGQHRLESVAHQRCTISTGHDCSSTVPLGSSSYEHDANHNRTKVTESATGGTAVTRTYCYDARDQLVARATGSALCTSSPDESYAYDAAGNRTEAVDASGTQTFSYTVDGQLSGVTHDASGRFSAWGGWTFTAYDAEGRLTAACDNPCGSSDPKLAFTYDADGRRTGITRTVGATTTITELRYTDGRLSAEYVNGAITRSYVTDESGAIVKFIDDPTGSPQTYLVTWNGHGDALNILHLSAGTLTLANSFTYGSWGQATLATHNSYPDLSFRYRYVGQHGVADDSLLGLPMLHMGARHYATALGRFIQPDPAALEANHYAYGGNPISGSDPCGTEYYPGYRLSQYEWNHCKWPWNWGTCSLVFGWGLTAFMSTTRLFGHNKDATRANAYQHCYWSALMAEWLGPSLARFYSDLHEMHQSPGARRTMDYRNNAVGRSVSASYGPWTWSLSQGCLTMLRTNRLTVSG